MTCPAARGPRFLATLPRGTLCAALLIPALACAPQDQTAASCCEALDPIEPAPLPGDSVWQIDSDWLDQNGRPVQFDDLRGEVTVLAMIFTHCLYACPRLVADIQQLAVDLETASGPTPRFLLVSMDHIRDDPATLRAFAARHGLDPAHWTLLHGDEPAVRTLAAVLGVKFRRAPSGDYSHSNQIAVLDRDGRIVHRQQGLQADSTKTLRVLADLLQN